MMNLDETKLAGIVETAAAKSADSSRWQKAIRRAHVELLSDNPYQHFDGSRFVVLSPSGELYEANGDCQCEAFRRGLACWHLSDGRRWTPRRL